MTQTSGDRRRRDLLLGEWACLGVLYDGPTHGFAIATALRPGGELGRVWSLSRALTYRSLDQLAARGLISAVGEEPGVAGGNRTVLAATRAGRAAVRRWLATPVEHLRDLRSELLLKLVIAERCGVDVSDMLERQRSMVADLAAAVGPADDADVVALWRRESSAAALRFLDRLLAPTADPPLAPTADPPLAPTADPPLAPTADPPLAPTADPPLAPTADSGGW